VSRVSRFGVRGLSRAASESKGATLGAIDLEGPISPATADHVRGAIDLSEKQQLDALIIRLDTPGGLLDSTKDIVQAFFAAKVPVVVYVAPAGARAASAGTFITLAADVAAMSPATTIGAAHPVTVGGGAQATDAAMGTKIDNYAASFIESIASKRDRNVQWAIKAVRDSAAITAEQALEMNVIEIVAEDRASLLRQLDGRKVDQQTLQTAGAKVEEIPMLLRELLFTLLWRPEVLLILMMMWVMMLMVAFCKSLLREMPQSRTVTQRQKSQQQQE
jgi:membrane-bound serine protease (ClpP class)